MRDPAELAVAFDRAARRAGGRYALIGGLAVSAGGQPRAMQVVDCLLDLPPEAEPAFCQALESEDLKASLADFAAARSDRSHATIFGARSTFHVECRLAWSDDERAQVSGAQEVGVPQGSLRVARAGDTVAYKVLFGSPQDLRDVRGILVRQRGRLDLVRLRALARRLGVLTRVEAMIREAESAQ